MHWCCYVHCVGLSFLRHDFNTLTSAQNSYILTVNLNMSYALSGCPLCCEQKTSEREKHILAYATYSLKFVTTVKCVNARTLLQSRSFHFLSTLAFVLVQVFCQRLALRQLSACCPSRCCMRSM